MQIVMLKIVISKKKSSFEVPFRADNHGCGRAIWSILVVCGIIEFSEELFGKVHDERFIIMAGWLSTVLTICLSWFYGILADFG